MLYVINIFSIIGCLLLLYLSLKNNKNYFSPTKILLVFFIFDAILPVTINGYDLLEYYNRNFCCLNRLDLELGYILYTFYLFLLILFIEYNKFYIFKSNIKQKLPKFLPYIFFTIWISLFIVEVSIYGGINQWFTTKIVFRWAGTQGSMLSATHTIISTLMFRMTWVFIALCSNDYSKNGRFISSLVILFMALTTFYRGTFFNWFNTLSLYLCWTPHF